MGNLKYIFGIEVDLWRSSGRTSMDISHDQYLLHGLAKLLRSLDKNNYYGEDSYVILKGLLNEMSSYEKQTDKERIRIVSHDGQRRMEIWTTDYQNAKEIKYKIDSFLGTKNYSSVRELLG